MDDRELAAYVQGVADAGARLVGVVAAELGTDHPVIARMVERLGQLPPSLRAREPVQYLSEADPGLTNPLTPGDDWYSHAHGWQRWGEDGRWHWLADPGEDHPDDGAPRRG